MCSLIGLCLAGCRGRRPHEPFIWHFGLSNTDMVNMASTIVVGVVNSVWFAGPPVTASDDRGNHSEWQLVEVSAAVENVLKGKAGHSVDFFYYTTLGPISGDTNSLRMGDRCVFFLLSRNGRLRAVRDYWRSSIEVGTGRHAVLPADSANVQQRIATLLLTAGTGLEPQRFERVIVRSVPIAEEWLGECRAVALLGRMLLYPSDEVRVPSKGS